MASEHIRELLSRETDPDGYRAIREEWKRHSLAEDARDIAGLLSTLTPDCVYEVVPTGHRWEGHAGAADFYGGLLGAFPDVVFDLQNIVIGPQGVYEEALFTGTHTGEWIGFPPTGRRVEFTVLIFFPWDPERRKFGGERVFFDTGILAASGIAGRVD
jgi:predicted ester cyclase